MRFRLGGCAVALVLVVSACGVDSGSDSAAPDAAAAETMELAELASARDTLPPAPHTATSLTVLLTHAGGADDPGIDAAAAALAQRPDIRVAIAATGTSPDGAVTMSGFPVTVVDGTDLVASTAAATGDAPELVIVGIDRTDGPGDAEAIASAAAHAGVPALVVEVEGGDEVDHAAAAMQLLEVLDLELDALLDEPAAVHRLIVPSCSSGSLRGRLVVRPAPVATSLGPSDCTSTDRSVPDDESSAVGAGYASLSRLP